MITKRPLVGEDFEALLESLSKDTYHIDTQPAFFSAPGTVCDVYEDEDGPVMFVRSTKSLRVDIQFCNNLEINRNKAVMLSKFEEFAERAKASGFTEIVFCTDSPLLKRFCKQSFGYEEVNGELRKLL